MMTEEHANLLVPEDLPADHRSGFVALVGKPNVGKSTLMNAFLGQKIAIVSPKPQTTRTRILGILTRPDAQVVFVDTPGVHQPHHKLGEFMVQTAAQAIADSDVVLLLVDASELPSQEDHQLAELVSHSAEGVVILGLNKMDLLSPALVKEHVETYLDLIQFQDWMLLSATRGDNLDLLLERIIAALPLGPQYYPEEQVSDQQLRTLAAELIREQVLNFTHQEVPHSVAVQVQRFEEREKRPVYIEAHIFVERDSQKGIIIGRGGRMLKEIGQAARQEIEDLLARRVYLDLWVKTRYKWRRDEQEVRRLGYTPPER
jgi:GTP-binding protein Era